jgi:hypothetical protein
MKNIFSLIIVTLFSFSIYAQDFEGILNIKTTYKESAKDTAPSISDFKMLVKGKKAMIDQKGFGRVILNTEKNELLAVLGEGTQPTIWKINLTTLNQLGGLLSLMKSVTGQDVMNINGNTVLTATATTSTISNYKSTKYTTADGGHTGTVWVTTDFPYDVTAIWTALNVQPALTKAGVEKGLILKADSKSSKTGESNSMVITPKKQVIEDKNFEIPAKGQMIDITPMLVQMMQNKKPEEVQQMLQQMMPRK